jgi:hypothetical protein
MSKSLKGISPFKLYYSKEFYPNEKNYPMTKKSYPKLKLKERVFNTSINKKKEDFESAFCLKINTLKKIYINNNKRNKVFRRNLKIYYTIKTTKKQTFTKIQKINRKTKTQTK